MNQQEVYIIGTIGVFFSCKISDKFEKYRVFPFSSIIIYSKYNAISHFKAKSDIYNM